MKRFAKIINDHINGKKTEASKYIFSSLSLHLQKMGYKVPFKVIAIKKTASITFLLPSQFEALEPLEVGDIMYDLKSFIFQNGGKIGHHGIDIDGDTDYFEETGVINIYFPKSNNFTEYIPPSEEEINNLDNEMRELYRRLENEENEEYKQRMEERIEDIHDVLSGFNMYKQYSEASSPEEISDLIEKYKLKNKDIEIGPTKLETSNSTGGPVMRVPIINNKTNDRVKYPEMNISNGNYYHLQKLLSDVGIEGLDKDGGRVSIDQLESVINSLENDPDFLENYTRESTDENSGGVRMIDMGLGYDQLRSYFTRLKQMIDFARKHNTGDEYISAG